MQYFYMYRLSSKHSISQFCLLSIFIAFTFSIAVSCQKSNDESTLGESEITFQLNGIDDGEEEIIKFTSNNQNRNQRNSINAPHVVEEASVEDLDLSTSLIVSSELNRIESSFDSESSKLKFASNAKRAAINPMPVGRQFRVLIYEQSGSEWRFVTHVDFVSATGNQGKTIKLVMDKTYRWVAYSYDSSDPIVDPLPQVGSTAVPTINTQSSQPTLYSSGGQFVNTATTATQYILFRHKTSKVEVVVDARGMFDQTGRYVTDIPLLSARLASNSGGIARLTTATLDLFTGQLSSQTLHSPSGIALNFTNLNSINGRDIANTYSSAKISTNPVYTALAPQQANFSATLNSVDVTESGGFADDGAITQSGNRTRTLITGTGQLTRTFASTTTDNSVGRVLRLNFRFAHRGVRVGNNFWATGGLYFEDSEYRIDRARTTSIAFKQNSTAPRQFYWRYGKRYPHQTGTTSWTTIAPVDNPIGDPCSFMQPRGMWRTSTTADLSDVSGRTRTRSGTGANNLVVYYAATDANPPTDYSRLYLHGYGYINPSLNLVPAATNNAHGIHLNSFSTTTPAPIQNPDNNPTYSGLRIGFTDTGNNIEYPSSFGMTSSHTVRCVRSAL
ncbi:hypothetical protein ACFSQ3_14550 [Sphingobacterium corticis]|uniref:Fimbrillin-like protein n=1 Tax=Sphingobacterium corticis TaxID=1812823 RepID=A0ABW5NMQ6_9SPHI